MAHILVIDDEPEYRALLKTMLEGAGHEVTLAPDGREGIARYRAEKADLIITDIIMPDTEGVETIRQLKIENPEVKIIAISGGGRLMAEDFLAMAQKFGTKRTLAKPFRRDTLLATIEEVLAE